MEDLADRPPGGLADGEELRLGKHRLRWLDAPHVPHAWECGYMFEESTRTLLCGDLFTQPGLGDEPLVEHDILEPSEAMRHAMEYYSHGKDKQLILRRIAATHPTTLACMHGSAWHGDGAALLLELGRRLAAAAGWPPAPGSAPRALGSGHRSKGRLGAAPSLEGGTVPLSILARAGSRLVRSLADPPNNRENRGAGDRCFGARGESLNILAYLPAQHLVESGEWRCDPVSVKKSVKMGLFKKFARMMEPPNREGSGVYRITARCKRCGEVIRARVNLSNDLSPEYDGEALTYVCRKVLIGENRCFQQIEVWLKFDANRKLVNREISGGSFADESVEQPL